MPQTRVFPDSLSDVVNRTKFEDLRTMSTVTLKDLAAIIETMMRAYERLSFGAYQLWGRDGSNVLATVLGIIDEREEAAREKERKEIQEKLDALKKPEQIEAELRDRLNALQPRRPSQDDLATLRRELAKAQAQLAAQQEPKHTAANG